MNYLITTKLKRILRHRLNGQALSAIAVLLSAMASAHAATVTEAVKNRLSWTVGMAFGDADKEYGVWEGRTSSAQDAMAFTSLGIHINTDTNGKGSVTSSNFVSTTTCIPCWITLALPAEPAFLPNGYPIPLAVRFRRARWSFFSLAPGNNGPGSVQIDNYATGQSGATYVDSYEAGSTVTLSFPGGGATWKNTSPSSITVSSSPAVLSLSVQSVSSSAVTIKVNSNSAPSTPVTLSVGGLVMNVTAPLGASVSIGISDTGTSTSYINGVAAQTGTFTSAAEDPIVLPVAVAQSSDADAPLPPWLAPTLALAFLAAAWRGRSRQW